MKTDVLAGQKLASLGALLPEPALDGDLLEVANGLGRFAEDAIVAPIELQSPAELAGCPAGLADRAVVAAPAGILRYGTLPLVEMVQKQRVLIRLKRRERIRTDRRRGAGQQAREHE